MQVFTTIGCVTSDERYQAGQSAGFAPFQGDVGYVPNAKPALIRPLFDRLELTRERGSN